jgi:uncharacterized protein
MRSLIVAAIAAALFAAGPVRAQTPTTSVAPENLAAARELIRVTKTEDQFKAKVPSLIASLKPMIVQNRPEVEKQYDAMMPTFQQQAVQRLDELTDALATIYARNFTVDELHAIAAFDATPTGQKLTEVSPSIGSQSVQAIGQWEQTLADDIKKQMAEHPN